MTKIVTFEFERGNFQEGFDVKLRIDQDQNDDGQLTYISQKYGKFPSAPYIVQNYQEWQLSYNEIGNFRMEIETAPSEEENEISLTEMLKECQKSSEQFLNNFKSWLISSLDIEAQNFRAELGIELGRQSDAKILIHIAPRIEQSTASMLKKLPWHHLKIADNTYIGVETAFVPQEPNKIVQEHFEQTSVKILAILGNSQGIDVESDRRTLEQFKEKGADIVFLPEPERFEVVESLRDNRWDILFFSGHSSSQDGRGRIFINQNESPSSLHPNSLTIEDLKNSLKKAIERGLRLAIFNSCDGLKLAEDLANLNIPQVIIMREPVPDKVAQEFLKLFLDEFSKEGNLYLAVRYARDRLQDGGWNDDYPGVSCLPLIFQNPTVASFSWPKKVHIPPSPPKKAQPSAREKAPSNSSPQKPKKPKPATNKTPLLEDIRRVIKQYGLIMGLSSAGIAFIFYMLQPIAPLIPILLILSTLATIAFAVATFFFKLYNPKWLPAVLFTVFSLIFSGMFFIYNGGIFKFPHPPHGRHFPPPHGRHGPPPFPPPFPPYHENEKHRPPPFPHERHRPPPFHKTDIAPLFDAINSGNKEMVKFLLERGIDPNSKSPFGPVLFIAVQNKDKDMVKLLLDNGVINST